MNIDCPECRLKYVAADTDRFVFNEVVNHVAHKQCDGCHVVMTAWWCDDETDVLVWSEEREKLLWQVMKGMDARIWYGVGECPRAHIDIKVFGLPEQFWHQFHGGPTLILERQIMYLQRWQDVDYATNLPTLWINGPNRIQREEPCQTPDPQD